MPDHHPQSVVFIHGVGGAARVWEPQMAAFRAAGYAPFPVDLPGYGGRPAIETIDFEQLSADVEAQIEGLERPVILGHSLGGMVAQTMLRRKPDAYQAVVLVGTSPAFGKADGDFQKKFVADRLAPLESGRTMPELAAGMINEIMSLDADPAGRELAVETMAATPPSTYKACVEAIVMFEERANLGQIRVPVLCIVGELDKNAPAPMMERMAAKIPAAQYVCLPNLSHLPNLENPAVFNAAVLDFLRRVAPPNAAQPALSRSATR